MAFPEKSEAERAKIASDMWENLGRIFAESFRLAELAAGRRVAFVSQDLLAGAAKGESQGAGHIFCAAHQANWEIAVLAITAQAKLKPAGVYQRIKNPLVDARVREMRASLYPAGSIRKIRRPPGN